MQVLAVTCKTLHGCFGYETVIRWTLSFSSHDQTFDSFPTSLGSADDLAPSFSKQLKAVEHCRKLWLSNVWTSPRLSSHMQAPLSGCRWTDWTPAPPAPISCVLDPVPHHLRMAVPQEPSSAGASRLPSALNQKSNMLLLLPFQKVFWMLLIYSLVFITKVFWGVDCASCQWLFPILQVSLHTALC